MKRRGGQAGDIIRSSVADFLGTPPALTPVEEDDKLKKAFMSNTPPGYRPTDAEWSRFKQQRAPVSRERPSINGGRTRRRRMRHRKTRHRSRQ